LAIKTVILSFPPRLIQEPVTYHLVRDYNLEVNILRATVRPRERGRMVVKIQGRKDDLEKGFQYLEDHGVQVDPLVQEMRYHADRCIHCTACTAMCPTDALTVDPGTRRVVFEPSACIVCESCIPACGYKAIESQF